MSPLGACARMNAVDFPESLTAAGTQCASPFELGNRIFYGRAGGGTCAGCHGRVRAAQAFVWVAQHIDVR
jgi:hypothetical protein